MSGADAAPPRAGTQRAAQALRERHDTADEASRTHRALLAHLRHELRTPLNAIIGYSEMLLDDAPAQGQQTVIPDLQKIHAAGTDLLARVNAILDPAAIDAGQLDGDLESVGATLRHELRTPITAVIGYSELLLDDAADQGQRALLPDLERIRAAAQRFLALIDDVVHVATTDAAAMTRELDSAGLPAMIQDVVSTMSALEEAGAAAQTDRGAVLVVDDNAINRDLLARRLERQGHTVAVAENGHQALELVRARPFDLVLLDVMMPELNGYQVLQQLKADATVRDIPVIMISALDELDSVVRCIELGAEDYLPKPFNPVLLRARIGACLEKKRLRDREIMYLQQIVAEKRRSDELLHVILPPEIVGELKATNTVAPRRYDNVAVLFCDIVGFTPYCDAHRPEDVVPPLQELVEAYEDIALRHDMQKIKTIGDAFMAVAGLLKPVQNPVLSCVRCGLEMIAAAQGHPPGWTVRIGIHVGPVVAGVLGHRQYLFDLWGDTVNTAARMESHGLAGAITLSGPAWTQIAEHCHGESLGAVKVKGKGETEMFLFKAFKTG